MLRHLRSKPVPPFLTQSWDSLSIFPSSSPASDSRASLLHHFFHILFRAGIEMHPDLVQSPCSVCGYRVHTGWVAFLCIVCNQWCHRRYPGIRSSARLPAAGPVELPNMLHPGPTSSPHPRGGVLRHGVDMFYSLFRGLPLPEFFFPPLSRPDEHFRSRTGLRGRQVSAVKLQRHTTLPRRTAGLLPPSPSVGRQCSRDQTLHELFPQRVHRLCLPSGKIARPKAVVDLSHSSTIPSPSGCLMVTFFRTMARQRSWWSS